MKSSTQKHIRVGLSTMKQPGVRAEGRGDAAKAGKVVRIMEQPGQTPDVKPQAGNLSTIMCQPAANRRSK